MCPPPLRRLALEVNLYRADESPTAAPPCGGRLFGRRLPGRRPAPPKKDPTFQPSNPPRFGSTMRTSPGLIFSTPIRSGSLSNHCQRQPIYVWGRRFSILISRPMKRDVGHVHLVTASQPRSGGVDGNLQELGLPWRDQPERPRLTGPARQTTETSGVRPCSMPCRNQSTSGCTIGSGLVWTQASMYVFSSSGAWSLAAVASLGKVPAERAAQRLSGPPCCGVRALPMSPWPSRRR